jgi:predicted RecB family nuclease
LVATKCDEFDD